MLDVQQSSSPEEWSHGDAEAGLGTDLEVGVEEIVPLLARPAVWIDPPAELGDDVIDSVVSELF